MGTDNLFHKRKARQAESLQRKKAKRDPYARILIVCEGKKTEPNYFKDLRKAFGLNPMNVVIADKKHQTPFWQSKPERCFFVLPAIPS
jgi:hypothetical protein